MASPLLTTPQEITPEVEQGQVFQFDNIPADQNNNNDNNNSYNNNETNDENNNMSGNIPKQTGFTQSSTQNDDLKNVEDAIATVEEQPQQGKVFKSELKLV